MCLSGVKENQNLKVRLNALQQRMGIVYNSVWAGFFKCVWKYRRENIGLAFLQAPLVFP